MDDQPSQASPSLAEFEADPDLAADPHALSVLSTEHWSLLSARSLAYNEAFTRTNMYLTFISLSFVALALLAQAMSISRDFLTLAAVVLGVDFVVGVLTSIRVVTAALEDTRATQGMNRIRQGYVRITPRVTPFLITGVHDDVPGIVQTYSMAEQPKVGGLGYALSTSGALVGLITSVVAGACASVVAILAAVPVGPLVVGLVTAIVTMAVGMWLAFRTVARHDAGLEARFPTPEHRVTASRGPHPDIESSHDVADRQPG